MMVFIQRPISGILVGISTLLLIGVAYSALTAAKKRKKAPTVEEVIAAAN